MTEQTKELLSVLMDGEASEIEVHRLLRMMGDDESIRRVWVTYQETRRVIRRPSGKTESGIHLSTAQHLALHSKISQAINDDVAHDLNNTASSPAVAEAISTGQKAKTGSTTGFGFRPATAFAMAASLVVAVFVGTQLGPIGDQFGNQRGDTVAVQSNPDDVIQAPVSRSDAALVTNLQSSSRPTNNTQLVSNNLASETGIRNEPSTGNLELRELDSEGQKRLREYLNEHEQMARMKSNTQFVTYPGASRQ